MSFHLRKHRLQRDVLADRQADTVAEWIRAHPGAEVICRDRAGAYAEAARAGAPDAIEVADRWHLWHNLAEAVKKTVAAHHHWLRKPETEAELTFHRTAPEHLKQVAEPVHTTRQETSILAIRTKIVSRRSRLSRTKAWESELSQGNSDWQGRPFVVSTTRTVSRSCWEHREPAGQRCWTSSPNIFTSVLGDGHASVTGLYEELKALGYRGSYSSVRDYLRPLRRIGAAPPSTPQVPKVRRITSWMLRHPDNLIDDEQIRLKQVLASCRYLEVAAGHVKSFAEMLTGRLGERLKSWMSAVSADDLTHLHRFVRGLETDHAAVRNGLTLPYSSGAVEGHVKRIEMLKRQMYGRAGFDLLRKRILLSN